MLACTSGHDDIVFGTFQADALIALLGNGTAHASAFSFVSTSITLPYVHWIRLADLTGDGFPEIGAACHFIVSNVVVLQNTGLMANFTVLFQDSLVSDGAVRDCARIDLGKACNRRNG